MKESIIISVDVLEHFNSIKNMNIKSFLNMLDILVKDSDSKKKLRDLYLDGFNGYHREVFRAFKVLLGEMK